jgi:hypothetical protein
MTACTLCETLFDADPRVIPVCDKCKAALAKAEAKSKATRDA